MASNSHADTVRRAALPEVMFASDLGLALDIPNETAEAAATSGKLGRHFTVRGRVAVLREDFLEALQTRAAINDSILKELFAPDSGRRRLGEASDER